MNTAGQARDIDNYGCEAYAPENFCGPNDDSDFSANAMCCFCGGGSTDLTGFCTDTAGQARDARNEGCDDYNVCGIFDDNDFSASQMCCFCGGGGAGHMVGSCSS